MWYNADTSSIYGGVNTPGSSWYVGTCYNAVLGTGAGSHNGGTLLYCTMVGYQAGMYCNEPKNTFIGCQAGRYQGYYSTTPDVGANTYIGYQSRYIQGLIPSATGFQNTFVGLQSGYNNLGSENKIPLSNIRG